MWIRNVLILNLLAVTVLAGCPNTKSRKETIRAGRTALGQTGGTNANGTTNSLNSTNQATIWGGLSAMPRMTQQDFDSRVKLFLEPGLHSASLEDQVGSVSMTPGQAGGVFFWGNVFLVNGQVDGARSRIHIEIFDNKVGQYRPNGTIYEMIPVDLNKGEGSASTITFKSGAMTLQLSGSTAASGDFQGTMTFSNSYTSNSWVTLGSFTVKANGFFMN